MSWVYPPTKRELHHLFDPLTPTTSLADSGRFESVAMSALWSQGDGTWVKGLEDSGEWYCSHGIHGSGIFTYIYHKDQLNVGKYTIHGSYGVERWWKYGVDFICSSLSTKKICDVPYKRQGLRFRVLLSKCCFPYMSFKLSRLTFVAVFANGGVCSQGMPKSSHEHFQMHAITRVSDVVGANWGNH